MGVGDHCPCCLDSGLAGAVVAAQESCRGCGGRISPLQGDAAHPQEKGLYLLSWPGNEAFIGIKDIIFKDCTVFNLLGRMAVVFKGSEIPKIASESDQ